MIVKALSALPDKFQLFKDEVHVWQVTASAAAATLANLASYLTNSERGQTQQFVFEKDQQRFTIARSMLRQLLSKYTQQPANQIEFWQNNYGKPFLKANEIKLEFNVSHSHEYILIGFSVDNPLGIDIEYMRENVDINTIAKRFFSAAEHQTLAQLPPTQQLAAFFTLWTQKEAIIKMSGTGLYQALNTVNPDSTDYFLHSLPAAEHYQAHLATMKQLQRIYFWEISADII